MFLLLEYFLFFLGYFSFLGKLNFFLLNCVETILIIVCWLLNWKKIIWDIALCCRSFQDILGIIWGHVSLFLVSCSIFFHEIMHIYSCDDSQKTTSILGIFLLVSRNSKYFHDILYIIYWYYSNGHELKNVLCRLLLEIFCGVNSLYCSMSL